MRRAVICVVARALAAPQLLGVLLGFSASYVLFFLTPVFSQHTADFGPFVPVWGPHAVDLRQCIGFSRSLFVPGGTPYAGRTMYPPLVFVYFAPLLLVPFPVAYVIVTILTISCYVLMALAFPPRESQAGFGSALLMLIFITGLFSYGFRFELERGQFNVIAVFCSFLAISIYHHRPGWRYLAYILFSLAVQAKLYPLIFMLMLIHDWGDWKGNLRRLALLTLANCVLLFALGPRLFLGFLKAVTSWPVSGDPLFRWVGNHSISSFLLWSQQSAPVQVRGILSHYLGWLQAALLTLVVACILVVVLQAWRQRRSGINPYLLLACTIASLLIPALSIDYKLAVLPVPVALFLLSTRPRKERSGNSLIILMLITLFSVAYSSTLFSFVNKTGLLANNLPALFTMLLVVTALCLFPAPPKPEIAAD